MLVGTFLEGETAILVASSLIHQNLFDAGPTVMIGFAGSFISDWLYYLIGRLNGKYFLARRPKLQAKLEPVQRLFRKHQIQILFSYRFLYGFRVIIPIVIGMSHVKPIQYLFYSVVSGLIWATSVGTIGFFAGQFLNLRTSVFEENIVLFVLGFAAFGLMLGYTLKNLAAKNLERDKSILGNP